MCLPFFFCLSCAWAVLTAAVYHLMLSCFDRTGPNWWMDLMILCIAYTPGDCGHTLLSSDLIWLLHSHPCCCLSLLTFPVLLQMPELNSAADSKDGKRFGMVKTFLLQNLGLITGYTIILFMARYGSTITFE